MKETDLKKEADEMFEELFMRKDRGFDKDKDGYDILIFDLSKAGNVGVLINFYQDLIDKATLAERKRCAEIARSYEPKLTDGGVEIKDEGIFVDINEAIATAINKDV